MSVGRWLACASAGPARAALESVYESIAREVESRGPACWASGRCCRFERAGHRLYVTGLEAAYAFVGAPPEARTPARVERALDQGGCPFQGVDVSVEGGTRAARNLCGLRASRPIGCRLYFCDRSAQAWQRDLSARALARVRSIHDEHAIDYRYAEWRALLGEIAAFVSARDAGA